MLEVAQHMDRCPGCRDEYHVIQEVKVLLRAVSRPQPAGSLEHEIRKRIATEEALSQINVCLSFSLRPQRAKRLATAMALSCISVLAVAAPFGAGTLALTYTRQPDKHMPFNVAISRRQDLSPFLSVPEASNDAFFANTVTSHEPQMRWRGNSASGYLTSQNQSYGSFASQELNNFGGDAPLFIYASR